MTSALVAYSCLFSSLRATSLHSSSISHTGEVMDSLMTSSIASKLRDKFAPLRSEGRSTNMSKFDIRIMGRFSALDTSTSFFTPVTPTLVSVIDISGLLACTSGKCIKGISI